MHRRIVRRLLWSWFLLLGAALLLLDVWAPSRYYRSQREAAQTQLEAAVHALALQHPASPAGLQEWVQAIARSAGVRASVLDPDGTLLADSTELSGEEFVYVSARLAGPNPGGLTLRIGIPLDAVRNEASSLRWWLAGGSVLLMACLAGVAALFLRAHSRRMRLLRNYAGHLLDPSGAELDLPRGHDDFGALALALHRMGPRIQGLVESLRHESARTEAILDSMTEGVLAVDPDLRVIFCNNSLARIVGAGAPVEDGTALLELVRDPTLLEIVKEVLASGQRVQRRVRLTGTQAHVFEVLAGPLAGGPQRGVLAILHDISELDRLERVRKDFVANVSHELRTPLAAIHGYAETLLSGALEDQENNRRFVEVIRAQAARLGNIASDLLALSELESGEPVRKQPAEIREAVQSALHSLEATAKARGVRLLCGNIPDILVRGPILRLEQVLVNLLENAVKFNRPEGEVSISVSANNGKAAIVIADTGIGIPSEDLPRIFERFYRVDKARSRALGGTGLGLSIVKHAVEQMGGSVRVESSLGEGSRFTVTLPLAG